MIDERISGVGNNFQRIMEVHHHEFDSRGLKIARSVEQNKN